MITFIKHISLSIIGTCLILSVTTQCMLQIKCNPSLKVRSYRHMHSHMKDTSHPHNPIQKTLKTAIIEAANEQISKHEWYKILCTYTDITELNQNFDELDTIAIQVATHALMYPNQNTERNGSDTSYINSKALQTFDILITKKLGIEEATQISVKAFTKSSDITVKLAALDLFKLLIDKNYALKEATKTTVIGLSDNDDLIRKKAYDLFKNICALNQDNTETKS